MALQPYLMFDGHCEEAFRFYEKALGGKIEMLMRFDEAPDQPPPGMLKPGSSKKVMHVSLKVGDDLLMGSDDCMEGSTSRFGGFSLSLAVPNAAAADKPFNALAEGGKVTMPLDKTFWSPRFGMLIDRYGVSWMVNAQPE